MKRTHMKTAMTLNTQADAFQEIIQSSQYTDRDKRPIAPELGTQCALAMLEATTTSGGNIFVIGNGGSAAVASHIITDFCNVGGLRAMTLHEPSVITCLSNDYGYEHVYSARLIKIARKEDVLIAISSSGNSLNMLNAAKCMRGIGANIITLTGFKPDNPLRQRGDLNFWVDSMQYGLVEIAHLFALHHWSDRMAVGWQSQAHQENLQVG